MNPLSHTSTITDIVINDVAALHAAVAELKQNGVRCELVANSKPRAYYATQDGMGVADYVLRLDDSKYDVGFYKTEDGKSYETRTDFFMGEVQNQIGVQDVTGISNQARMGKLYNLYAVHAATRRASQQGYQVNRINNDDGSVRLVIAA